LAKVGTGTLTVAGSSANTYSGLTTLTNGLLGLAKPAGVAAVPGDFTGDNALSPDLFTKANNQFNPASVMRFTGTSGDHVRFELLGTTQTLAGVDNATGTGRGVIQHREQVTEAAVGTASELVLAGAGTYGFNGYARNTGGSLALTKTGSGTQTLSGANITYTGLTVVADGRLVLSNASAFASPITNDAVVEFAASAVGQHSRALTGPGLWFKTGTGTQHLNGGSTAPIAPSGQILVQQGVLQNNNNAVNWSNNLAGIDISAGAALDLYADPILTPTLTGQGVVRSFFGNAANYSGIASNTERLTVGLTDASSLFEGTLTDSGTNGTGAGKGLLELLKAGSGTLTLSGTNTHGGATLVGAGTLALAASARCATRR
jgi:autotransporter-associated beta strand protein